MIVRGIVPGRLLHAEIKDRQWIRDGWYDILPGVHEESRWDIEYFRIDPEIHPGHGFPSLYEKLEKVLDLEPAENRVKRKSGIWLVFNHPEAEPLLALHGGYKNQFNTSVRFEIKDSAYKESESIYGNDDDFHPVESPTSRVYAMGS